LHLLLQLLLPIPLHFRRMPHFKNAPMSKYQFDVEVLSAYLPEQSAPTHAHFAFSYTITIVNTGEVPAQLISRYWQIIDQQGRTQEVKGLGVVGQQPLLKPGEAFQYTSGCVLPTGFGSMQGHYFCVAEDGERFEVPIAAFVLDASVGTQQDDAPVSRTLH